MLRFFRRKRHPPRKKDMDTPWPLYWEDGFSPDVYQLNSRFNQLRLAEWMGVRIPHTVRYEEFLADPFFPVVVKDKLHFNYGCAQSIKELEEVTEAKFERLMFQEFIGNRQLPDIYFDMRVLVFHRMSNIRQELLHKFEILAAMVRYNEEDFRTNLWRDGKAIPLTGKNRYSGLSERERQILEFLQIDTHKRGIPEEVADMLNRTRDDYDGTFMRVMYSTPEISIENLYGYDFIYGTSMSDPSHSPTDENGWYFLECNIRPGTGILGITGTEPPRYT